LKQPAWGQSEVGQGRLIVARDFLKADCEQRYSGGDEATPVLPKWKQQAPDIGERNNQNLRATQFGLADMRFEQTSTNKTANQQ
jgi:hypothetical protein